MSGSSEGGFPVGAIVTLSGIKGKISPIAPEGEALDFNGAHAQLIEYLTKEGLWLVVTFSGYVIKIEKEKCQLLTDNDMEGYDLVMGPSSVLAELVGQMSSLLVEKGFFMMNVLIGQQNVNEIFEVVKTLEEGEMFTRLPTNFEPGYLGQNTRGAKVANLEPGNADTPQIILNSALPAQDQTISMLMELLKPSMQEQCGFEIYSRSNLMMQLSFTDFEDEASYLPPAATNKEVDAFLGLMGRKKMCVLHFLGPATSELKLVPKSAESAEVSLEVKPNTMIMFLTDQYDYCYDASPGSLTLQSFFLEEPVEFKFEQIAGNVEMLGMVPLAGAPPPAGEQIIVKGLASRDPCCADQHEKLWSAVRHGGCDGFCEIPHKRFDIDLYIEYNDQQAAVSTGRSYCRHQGQIEGMEAFDASFFSLPDSEIWGMDPEQRIIMETGWLALADSGYERKKLQKDSAHMGVYVGISGSDWRDVNQAGGSPNGCPETFIANRFSYCINLKGPSFVLNTACSASLVAAHTAKLHLLFPHDPLDGAVVAGISLNTSANTWIGNCSGNMLSFIGRSFTFNSTADGYGRGEGCASMVIKRGEYRSEDPSTYCLFAGSHSNSDGKSASLTAPNGPAQQRLLRAVLAETQLQPVEICVYEAHGTGTSLGDPIEIGAVRKVLNQRAYPIMISCSKTNLGHLEGGAGMSAFCKCILAVMHCETAPNLHYREQNPHLDIDGWPGNMIVEGQPMKADSTYVGVSGFGYGGTNSHALAYSKNVMTSRGTNPKYAMDTFMKKVKAATVPDVWMDGDNYEDWTTTGMPRLNPQVGKTYNIEILPGGKTVWREAAEPEMPETLSTFHIMGTFTNWELLNFQPSDAAEGLYTYEVTLSATGQESFQVAVDHDPELNLYPAQEECSKKAAKVLGPAPAPSRKNCWVIKGEAGKTYTIELFRPTASTTSVTWCKVPEVTTGSSRALMDTGEGSVPVMVSGEGSVPIVTVSE